MDSAWKMRHGVFFLREYFFPEGCALCGTALVSADETWYGLCESCRNGIDTDWAADNGAGGCCDRCGRPLISEQGRCLSCRTGGEPAFDRIITLFPYSGKYNRLLRAYKFGKNLALGNFFAEKLRKILEDFSGAAIVPVPPRPGKIRKTGWDQVEYLARRLEKGRELSVSRCLKRLPSKVQKELNREDRITNLRSRIILKKPPSAKTVIIIDDVMTTGSTMDVCADVLKTGGAQNALGLCLFYGLG